MICLRRFSAGLRKGLSRTYPDLSSLHRFTFLIIHCERDYRYLLSQFTPVPSATPAPQPTPAHSSPLQLPSHPLQPPRLHRRTYSSARFHQPHRKPDMVFLYLSGFESAIYGLCQLRSELSIFRGVLLQSRVALDRPPGPIFTLQGWGKYQGGDKSPNGTPETDVFSALSALSAFEAPSKRL